MDYTFFQFFVNILLYTNHHVVNMISNQFYRLLYNSPGAKIILILERGPMTDQSSNSIKLSTLANQQHFWDLLIMTE